MYRIALVAIVLAASAFPLFAAADLHLRAEPAETRLPVSTRFQLRLSVSNLGPDAAHDVTLQLTGSDALLVRQLPPGCAASNDAITCDVGELPERAGGDRTHHFVFNAPAAGISSTITATVSSPDEDPNPANNVVSRSYDFVDAVAFSGDIAVSSRLFDPGQTTRVVTSLRNEVASNPHDVRIYYEVDRGTILTIEADPRWRCVADGGRAQCVAHSLDPDCRCSGDIVLNLLLPDGQEGTPSTLSMAATSSLPDFFRPMRKEARLSVWRWLTVTSTAAGGPGSLRDTIWRVNEECGDEPCKIAFALDGSQLVDGVAVIAPSEPLPVILATNVHLDGGTQTLYGGDTNPQGPEVMIDGRLLTKGRGIEMHSSCDAIISGLAIVNFPEEAIVYDNTNPCMTPRERQVRNNYIGVDARGKAAMPNHRGVYVSGDYAEVIGNVLSGNERAGVWGDSRYFRAIENRIGTSADGLTPIPNGASGIYVTPRNQWAEVLSNTISWNVEMGVAVARAASYVDVRMNSMRQNGGLGIDVGLDGRDPKRDDENEQSNPPVLHSAVYDSASGTTIVTGTLQTDPLGPYGNSFQIDLYANDGPNADGEEWLFYTWHAPIRNDGTPFTLIVNRDLRGKRLNATSTRVHFIASDPPDVSASARVTPDAIAGGDAKTSELSQAIPVTQQ